MMGLIVDQIVNVIDKLPNIDKLEFAQDAIEGTAIIDGQATLILDSEKLFHKFFQTFQKKLYINN